MEQRTLRLLEYDAIREMLTRYAATSLGQALVARMRPAHDAAVIGARLAETGEARRIIAETGPAPFGGLRDIRDALRRAEKLGVLTAQELLDVAESAASCRRLHRYFRTTGERFPLLKAQGMLLEEFPTVEQAVDIAISATGEVLDTASPDLQQARRRVRALREDIRRELQRVIASPALQEPIITMRNGRFCVPVRAEQRHSFSGIVHDISASGQTVFMEPMSVVDMGNDLREAERQEEEEVYRVLTTISGVVAGVAVKFLSCLETAARLDGICARALFADVLEATPPEFNEEGIIDLREARHPLLGAHAVPIDVVFGSPEHTTLLITGPNTGGKTVTLKTVGLLVLMAQSGLHLPVHAGSRLPIFTQVFADIGDEQSIAQNLSTFSSHMTSIVHVVQQADMHALILFDEIGAGTDPAEGAALAKAILLELQARGCRCIATTHYGELKLFAQNTAGFLNASVEFDLDTLRPTYRVLSGLPGSSNALAIAQRLGLPKALIARARELMGETPQAIERAIKQAEGARRAFDRERTAAAAARREAEENAARLQRELHELAEKKDAALAKAREHAQQVLQLARTEANTLLDELRAALREAREGGKASQPIASFRRKAHETLQELSAEIETLPSHPAAAAAPSPAFAEVAAGQLVYIRSLDCRGTTLEAGRGDAEVYVQAGILRVRVSIHDLAPITAAPSGYTRPLPGAGTASLPQFDPEIHLLGKRAEEAAQQLEAYLYDALEQGVARVRIIHGFGTGTLRQVVQELLRYHPAVRAFRQGEQHEGGGGRHDCRRGVA